MAEIQEKLLGEAVAEVAQPLGIGPAIAPNTKIMEAMYTGAKKVINRSNG